MKGILSNIPGFRSGKLWKKIISVIAHTLILTIITGMLTIQDEKVFGQSDIISNKLTSLLILICFILAPYIMVTNIFGLRSKLPLFKKGTAIGMIFGTLLSIAAILTVYVSGFTALDGLHTPEYKEAAKVERKAAEEKRLALEQAKQKEQEEAIKKVEEKKQAELHAKAQAVAKSEAEDQADFDAKAKADAEELNAKIMAKFEKALNKHITKDITNLYFSSDSTHKSLMEDRIDAEYIKYVSEERSHILAKDFDEISKLHSELQFIDSIPPMKSKNIWTIYAYLDDMINNNNALEELKKEFPEASDTGLIKSVYDIQELECYVNYKIKNVGTTIGNITINNESYTDMYYISNYDYSQFTGYLPSNDWEAILKPRGTIIDRQGVYSFKAIQAGTEKLIDSNGFEQEYSLYIELTQNDIDLFNKNAEFIDKSSTYNGIIDNSANRLCEYLN